VHSHINGVDSITRQEYHATDVDYALWTHALGLVAMIDTYGQFGGGLTVAEQNRFVDENVAFAQLVGIAPEDAPRTVAGCRTIVDDWMPRMAYGLKGHQGVDFFVNPPYAPAWPMAVAGPGLRI
jgi:uncharacterized protein (DUF2236 family)